MLFPLIWSNFFFIEIHNFFAQTVSSLTNQSFFFIHIQRVFFCNICPHSPYVIFFSFSKATFLLPQNVLTHHPRTIFLQPSFFAINVLTHYIYIQERVFFFAFKECPHSPSQFLFFLT